MFSFERNYQTKNYNNYNKYESTNNNQTEKIGIIGIKKDPNGIYVIETGKKDLKEELEKALTSDKGVKLVEVDKGEDVCLIEPDKKYEYSICKIIDDMSEE